MGHDGVAAWSVVEEFIEGKSDNIVCEDLIVVTPDFAAVLDGASDATGMTFAGRSGGRYAAETIRLAIEGLDVQVSVREFADQLTARVGQAVAARLVISIPRRDGRRQA